MWKRPTIGLCLIGAGIYGGWFGAKWLSLHIWMLSGPHYAGAYLRSHPVRKLQLGAGLGEYPGWLNTDYLPATENDVYLDVTKPFPLPDGSIHYIYAEHVIEHISYDEGLAVLRECHRVLARDGRIRLATPNLDKYLALFASAPAADAEQYEADKLRLHHWHQSSEPASVILNSEMRSWGHRFLYNPRTLSERLVAAGFVAVTEFPPGVSNDPQLRGIESRHNDPDRLARAVNDYETMVLEAVRP